MMLIVSGAQSGERAEIHVAYMDLSSRMYEPNRAVRLYQDLDRPYMLRMYLVLQVE